MNKGLKYALLALAAIPALLIIAIVIFVVTFDAAAYKTRIAAFVEKSTGRELTISGDIELSFFPWLGVSVGAMQLSNAEGFGPSPLAQLDAAEIRIEVLPLLRGAVNADTITLQGLHLELVTDPDGTTNWDDLAGSDGAAAENGAGAENGASAAPLLAAVAIGGIRITDARIVWDDRQAAQRFTIDNFTLTSGPLVPGRPVDLQITLDMDSEPQLMAGKLRLATTATLDPAAQRYRLAGLELNADLRSASLPGGALPLDAAADVDLDLVRQQLDVANIAVQTAGTAIQGNISASDINDGIQYAGNIEITLPEPRKTLAQLDVALETSDPAALQHMTVDTDFKGSARRIDIERVAARLDDTRIDGSLGIADFTAPAITFRLDIDGIDLDRYLPPAEEPVAGTPASAAAAGADAVPLDTLRALDLDGSLRIGELKVANLRTSDFTATVGAKDGIIRLHPLAARLYGGQYAGDTRMDARGAALVLSLNERLSGVQAGPLLADLFDNDMISGTANVEAQVTVRGTTPEQARKTINGSAAFAFTDGAIKGLNIAKMVRETKARIDRQPLPAESEPRQTDFSELTGTLQINDGLVRNDDLSVKAPFLRVTGKGTADLVGEKLDYLATIKIVETQKGQAGQDLEALKGVAIPLRISGTFSEPAFKVDLEPVLKARAQEALDKLKAEKQQEVERKEEEIKQELEQKRDELKDRLREKLRQQF